MNEFQILDCFPLEAPREKQQTALKFIQDSIERGYHDIVISAPTGIGKTAIGASSCFWGAKADLPGASGGYYLVTQRMLQDQLERDFPGYRRGLGSGALLKSASEYECPTFKLCSAGQAAKSRRCALGQNCAYKLAKNQFLGATLAVTNYAYFLTEKMHVGRLPARKVLVADECHACEKVLLRHVDLVVSEATLPDWAPTIGKLPALETLQDYVSWIRSTYLPVVSTRAEAMRELAESGSDKMVKEAFKLEQHVNKVSKACELIAQDSREWVFWSAGDEPGREYIARPLNAAPFMPLLTSMGAVRIYMSAFPGTKTVFCRSLGLDPNSVAWCGLKSTFPVANRPVILVNSGSMSRRNQSQSLPLFMTVLERVFARHANEKGLVHCNSYALGKLIFEHFRGTAHGQRLIFPLKADEREEAFALHCNAESPTVLLTPSMTEGFDFRGDLATWQVISKVPYPSLSDLQVVAKKERDPDWYVMETAKGIVQAAGRIVRSDTDVGTTYVMDSDFDGLVNRYGSFFPRWFTDAFVYPKDLRR